MPTGQWSLVQAPFPHDTRSTSLPKCTSYKKGLSPTFYELPRAATDVALGDRPFVATASNFEQRRIVTVRNVTMEPAMPGHEGPEETSPWTLDARSAYAFAPSTIT